MPHDTKPSPQPALAASDPDPRGLEARCDGLFVGSLAMWSGSLAFRPHLDAVTPEATGDEALFDALLARFARAHPGADRQALTSLWSQHYFARLTIAATVFCLAADGPLPIDFRGMTVRFCPHLGTPLCFHLGQGGEPRRADSLVKALYDDQVTPMVTRLKRHGGLSARLLWENAGGYGMWILGEIARTRPGLAPAAEALLRDGAWPRAGCALLPHMKGAAREARPCGRRVCCLRYRVPGSERCAGICPRPAGS